MKNKQYKWLDSAIMKEDESRPTQNEKHFIMNNGTRKAVFSPTNVNYFDKSEHKWKPIDSTLKADDNGYHAQLGTYTARFSKTSSNETVEVCDESTSITWEYLGTKRNVFTLLARGNTENKAKRKSKLAVTSSIRDDVKLTTTSRAVYQDAEGDIDLDYSIEGNGIKENIVVKEKSDSYRYYFLLRITGFEIKFAQDGFGLEFYKTNTEGDGEEQTPEFMMPAPFMYDANGGYSNNVKYGVETIEDGIFLFSVEADAEWINAQERVFPIYIDPQLLTVNGDPYVRVSHNEYSRQICGCECDWTFTFNPNYDHVYLINYATNRCNAVVSIDKRRVPLGKCRVLSAKLVFDKYSAQTYPFPVTINIDGKTYVHNNESQLIVDITASYNASSDVSKLHMSLETVGTVRSFKLPTLQIEYQPFNVSTVNKKLSVENGVSADWSVLSGNATLVFDDIADPALGVGVSHVYKPNDSIAEYGRNFRLNLDEKLTKTSNSSTGAQYSYTDANGDVHTFDEHFYQIGNAGEKVYLLSELDSVNADAEGRLWLNGVEVFRELTTDKGLRAATRLEGIVNNAEWVEQRMDEEKQAEEQVKSYKNTLCNFVSVNKKTGEIKNSLIENDLLSPDYVENFLNIGNDDLLLSKEEAMTYKSLVTQKKSLDVSLAAFELQQENLKHNAESLWQQYRTPDSFDYQEKSNQNQLEMLAQEVAQLNASKTNQNPNGINGIYDAKIKLMGFGDPHEPTQLQLLEQSNQLIEAQKSALDVQKQLIAKQLHKFSTDEHGFVFPGMSNDGLMKLQYANIEAQINVINTQLDDINSQINLYISKSSKYIDQFKSYYKEYLRLKNQLDKLYQQVPVAYLISDSIVKGFNDAGDLVIVQDKYGKYVVIEREVYNTASGTKRISSVYDQDSRAMIFSYNANNKLSEICNSLGERVAFEYDTSGYLTTIKREGQHALTLSYTFPLSVRRINKIESSDKTSATLTYNTSDMLTNITRKTTVSGIAHDDVQTGAEVTLASVTITYTDSDTTLTYDGSRKEIYTVDQASDQVTAHYEIVNGKVANAERYTYSDYLLTKTEHADKSCLNRYSYAAFAAQMQVETVEEVTYNTFKDPVVVVASKYAVPRADGDCPTEQTIVEYTYNDNRKLTEKKTTHSYCDDGEPGDTTVSVEKYYYNNAGELVRKESYVEGEELKTGINVEEHVFNEKGVEIQSFTYNSLDPSSKFYTENEVDEQGRTLAAFDESGEHKTTFDYERDGVTVRTEHLPNGSKFSYGRDKDGTVSAITHSTENGEENSTTQTRTLDVVTEVKSGNNTVQYTYDNKRRVKSVSLNGVDDYVTYTYSGEHTNAETVTATLAKDSDCEIVSKSIKNAHGNVTKSTCGDRTVNNTYDAEQHLTQTVDSVSGTTTLTYDDKGKVSAVTAPDHSEAFAYDEQDNTLDSKTVTVNGITHTYEYGYKPTADKALDSISVDGNTVRPNTDALGRNTGKVIEVGTNKVAEEKLSYVKFGDHATNLPSTVRFASNGVFKESMQYRYDSMGNIVEILENGRSACRYEYDALGRLTREDNVAFAKTTTWAYDNNGNIIARYEYAITTKPTNELYLLNCKTFTYCYDDNSDQLLSITKDDGSTVTTELFVYDQIGNPETYRGTSAAWQYGRQLATYKGCTFGYDARGRRISKQKGTDPAITFTYDSNGNLIKQSNGLDFLYDHTGVFAVKHGTQTYFYRKDACANIVELLDSDGDTVVKYKYDAWGNCVIDASTTNTELANLNPFRYRSYYYDTETKLYFLKTRYYDPEIGRLITIDDISYLDPESINGLNLYAYCLNNPVMMVDNSGCAPALWQWVESGVIIGLGIALCFTPLAPLGVGLIVSGATSMVSNIMSAAGVDGRTATIVSNVLSIVGGAILCFTPFAAMGASMIGSGVLGIAGGYISESLGGSFKLGSTIGNIVGGFLGGQIYKGLVNHGVIPFKTSTKNIVESLDDPINNPNIGPKQGLVTDKIHQIQQTGRYEIIDVIKLPNGSYQAQDGHHNLRALISLGYKYVWVKITK